jgi:hypothetical protein
MNVEIYQFGGKFQKDVADRIKASRDVGTVRILYGLQKRKVPDPPVVHKELEVFPIFPVLVRGGGNDPEREPCTGAGNFMEKVLVSFLWIHAGNPFPEVRDREKESEFILQEQFKSAIRKGESFLQEHTLTEVCFRGGALEEASSGR